ncbi:ATPase YjeE [Photobacterium damselae subsp. damselae CIP 102761]|uniref:ATPase YjeE n=2 Tax=Photobacterium damselae TaxID=38293 RepID=D0Z0H4_PHODD|nr:ATPase YjeE [Photobacterium damselae subsp. damselae CIP 102761]
MGIRDYFSNDAICLVEWPEKGTGLLPQPDLELEMLYHGEQRKVIITAQSEYGEQLLSRLEKC